MILLALLAHADPRQDLEDALLARAMGDHGEARVGLLALRNGLPDEDPVRSWALYWLAMLQYESDEHAGARESLRECIRLGAARRECVDMLGRLEVESSSIRTIPTVWNFSGEHGIAHYWTQDDRGSIRTDTSADPKLVWTALRDEDDPATLLFGVRNPRPTPTVFRGTFTVDGPATRIGILFVDEAGNFFPHPRGIVTMDPGETLRMRLNLREAAGPTGRLDPRRLERVLIRDLSPARYRDEGNTILTLDDVGLE